MDTYIVLYRPDFLLPPEAPFGFRCQAEDADHAEDQCENAYPEVEMVWVWAGDNLQDALDDYWTVSDFDEA